MSTPVLTVANLLTMSRMGLAPLLVVLILWGEMQWAFAVFVIAGLTDLLDGLIARWGQQQTTLGAMLDPVADKILLTASCVALTWTLRPAHVAAGLADRRDPVPRRDHHRRRGGREPDARTARVLSVDPGQARDPEPAGERRAWCCC